MKKLIALLFPGFALLAILAAYGCGGAASTATPLPVSTTPAVVTPLPSSTLAVILPSATPTVWVPPTALAGTPIPGAEATQTAAPRLQVGKLTITNSAGEKVEMTVEIANTEPARELGLMFRDTMPPDAGMLFDFQAETDGGFWMENTILPLSIAFFRKDGSIVSIADMQALKTDIVNATGPYYYALETNQGFLRAHNINPNDIVTLPVDTNAVIPGMPSVGK